MAKKDIRTKYIKSLVADKDAMAKVLEESTKESLSSLLDETVNRSLRQMLAESDDSYDEEEVGTEPEFDMNSQNDVNDDNAEGGVDDMSQESGEDTGSCENGECGVETDGNDVWADVEDCKDSDGEYDLRGKDIETVLKLIQSMDKNDSVRIIKNSDDTAIVEPENGEDEFVIDIDDNGEDAEPNDFENEMGSDTDNAMDGEDGLDADNIEGGDEGMMDGIDLDDIESDDQGDEDVEFELELGDNDENPEDDMVNEGNVNLGYTDNYQKKSAMTMPNDKGDSEGDSRFDDGAPKGGSNNKKRWVGHDGQNGGNPYSQKTKQPMSENTDECGDKGCSAEECNEETIFEMELDNKVNTDMPVDERMTRGQAVNRKTTMTHARDNDTEDKTGRNVRVKAQQVKGTGEGVDESRMASLERHANALLNENKDLRDIAAQIKQQLNEAVLINASLAKIIKLFTENSTTRDEKINILNRFNKVQSLNECKNLYNQIAGELKGSHSVNNSNLLNRQLTEAKSQNKNMIVETNMLNQSEDLRQMLDLNERLMKLGK